MSPTSPGRYDTAKTRSKIEPGNSWYPLHEKTACNCHYDELTYDLHREHLNRPNRLLPQAQRNPVGLGAKHDLQQ